MVAAIAPSTSGKEINIHLDPIDYFAPFCFDLNKCLVFDDPIAVRGNTSAETERLDVLGTTRNLSAADVDALYLFLQTIE